MTDRSVSARAGHQDRVGTSVPVRTSPLHETLNAAGGQMVERCGTLVVRDFGSAASEAAVCQRAVGIADRSDLVKLELRGRQARLLELIEQLTGARPDVASALASTADHAWWCVVAPERVLVLGDACQASRFLRVIELAANRGAVTLADASQTLAAIAVVGPRAAGLLGAASDFDGGEPPTTEQLATVPIAGSGGDRPAPVPDRVPRGGRGRERCGYLGRASPGRPGPRRRLGRPRGNRAPRDQRSDERPPVASLTSG